MLTTPYLNPPRAEREVNVKTGVALSGCDLGGICAWAVLDELTAQGFYIEMVSASCIPAAAALLYANNYTSESMRKHSENFLNDARESDIDFAVANLASGFHESGGKRTRLCVNAVDVSDGEIVVFTDDYAFSGENLKTFAGAEPFDIISATVSLVDGLGCYRYRGRRLCDFCCWYGAPVHQLRLAGMERIISVSFLPRKSKTPYEASARRVIMNAASLADIHIPIDFGDEASGLDEYVKIATDKIKSSMNEIAAKILF